MQLSDQAVKQMYKAGKMIHGVELTMDHAFGINSSPISNQLQIVGEDRVVFMMGNTIVLKDLKDGQEQVFITRQGRFRSVTALYCYCQQKKDRARAPIVIFLGESSSSQEEMAMIVLLETDKNKMKLINTNCRGIIDQICVNQERGQVCVIINSGQGLQIVLHNFERNRFIASCSTKFGLDKISLHPNKQKNKQLFFMGVSFFRIWNVFHQEQTIKESYDNLISLSVQKQHKFNDHCWTTINKVHTLLIIAKHLLTNKNRILIIQNQTLVHTVYIQVSQIKSMNTFKRQDKEERKGLTLVDLKQRDLHPEPEQINLKSVQFTAIAPTKKGFVLGGSKKVLVVYDFEKAMSIVNTLTFFAKGAELIEQQKIVKIHLSSNQEIISFNTINQIGSMNFYIVNTYQLDSEANSIQPFFRAGFHTKGVHALSRSITKSILASCSDDNTVKLWNFFQSQNSQKSGILSASMSDQPLCVSIHPSGLFVAVSFSYGFKIMAVVSDQLIMLKENQLPNCSLIKYSNGGHYLIVNQKQHIFVYDTVYYQTIYVFSLTAPVHKITLSEDDLYMVTTCIQGHVYCQSFLDAFKMNSQKIMVFSHQETSMYMCIAYDSCIQKQSEVKTDLFVGATAEKYMVIYKNKCKQLVAQFPITDCYISAMLISKSLKVLFVGTSTGRIRVYLWPLDQSNLVWQPVSKTQVRIKPPPFYQILVHASVITDLSLSHDEKYLFSSDQEGTIVCLKIHQKTSQQQRKDKGGIKDQDKKRIAQTANDLYLQRLEVIQRKNQTIQNYRTSVIQSEQRLKLQREKLQLMSRQNLDNLRKQFNATLQTERRMKETYIQSNQKEYQNLQEQLNKEKQKYEKQIEQFKNNNRKKIEYEEKRNQNLRQEITDLKNKHQQELLRIQQEHRQELKNNKIAFYERCQKLQVKYSNVVDASKRNADQFIKDLDNTQAQNQQEIQRLIREKSQEIKKIQAINQQLTVKNDKLKRKYDQLKKEDQELQIQFQKKFKEHNSIRFQNFRNDQDILKMQHQLLERLQVIDSKEETCKNARYEQATLENFRYILDSKIESLQEKKKMMMKKIEQKENDLKHMLNELVKESKQNERKYRKLKQYHAKLQVLDRDIKSSQAEINANSQYLAYIQNQLSKIIKSDDQPKIIASKLRTILDSTKVDQQMFSSSAQAQRSGKGSSQETAQVNQQLQRQNKWMTKKLQLIKVTSSKFKQVRQSNINSIINQNVKLIQQCTNLRNDNEELRSEIANYQKKLDEFRRKKQRNQLRKNQLSNKQDMSKLDRKMQEQQAKLQQQRQQLLNLMDNKQKKQDKKDDTRILKYLEEE